MKNSFKYFGLISIIILILLTGYSSAIIIIEPLVEIETDDILYKFNSDFNFTGDIDIDSKVLNLESSYIFNITTEEGDCNITIITLNSTNKIWNTTCNSSTDWLYHRIGNFSGNPVLYIDDILNQTLNSSNNYINFNYTGGFSEHKFELREISDMSYGVNNGITFILPCNINTGTTNGEPTGQNSTLASIWCKNTGSSAEDFQIKLNQTIGTGWTIWITNTSGGTPVILNTSYQSFYYNINSGVNISNCAWVFNNCSANASSPNVDIELQAVSS